MRVWSRADWGARPPKSVTPAEPPQVYAVVHHTVTGWPDTPDDAAAQCRNIQAFHQDVRGWADIGYSWLIGDGDVFEGRGWGVAQAAQVGYNSTALSFAIIGDGSITPAPARDLEAVAQVIRSGIALGQLPHDVPIVAHRDLNPDTACCGDAIYAQLDTIRTLVYGGGPVTPTEQIVADMYRLWALRPGDPAGIKYWADQIDAGTDPQYVAFQMLYNEGWSRMVDRTGGRG